MMTISEVANEVGMPPSTLRYYERIGLVPAPPRISGRRRYDANIVQRLTIIQTAQRAGFTLDEIRLLFDEVLADTASRAQWNMLIQQKLREINSLLLNVQSMKTLLEDIMECSDSELEECIALTGQKHGSKLEE